MLLPRWIYIVSDNPDSGVSGEVMFKQWNINTPVVVKINITGLPMGKHSVHIHSFGDLTEGCKSTGPHFRSSIVRKTLLTTLVE